MIQCELQKKYSKLQEAGVKRVTLNDEVLSPVSIPILYDITSSPPFTDLLGSGGGLPPWKEGHRNDCPL